jgi:hypothetical protein
MVLTGPRCAPVAESGRGGGGLPLGQALQRLLFFSVNFENVGQAKLIQQVFERGGEAAESQVAVAPHRRGFQSQQGSDPGAIQVADHFQVHEDFASALIQQPEEASAKGIHGHPGPDITGQLQDNYVVAPPFPDS